jgi:hypothetical protein
MTGSRGDDDFAFAEVVRTSAPFEDTGGIKSRRIPASVSVFRRSAKWHFLRAGYGVRPFMTTPSYSFALKEDRRLQAVMALFRGEPLSQAAVKFRMARRDLYKFRTRALVALRAALAGQSRGPWHPHNRLSVERAQQVVSLCQGHPALSAYQAQKRLGTDTPHPRPIRRLRKRSGLVRLPKRAPSSAPVQWLPLGVLARAEEDYRVRGSTSTIVWHPRSSLSARRASLDMR